MRATAADKPKKLSRGYAAFLRESMARQRRYIKGEQERMGEASRLFALYQESMARLELHPLTHNEISDRIAQLKWMSERVEETHGDTEGQRALYEMREGTLALPREALADDLGIGECAPVESQ